MPPSPDLKQRPAATTHQHPCNLRSSESAASLAMRSNTLHPHLHTFPSRTTPFHQASTNQHTKPTRTTHLAQLGVCGLVGHPVQQRHELRQEWPRLRRVLHLRPSERGRGGAVQGGKLSQGRRGGGGAREQSRRPRRGDSGARSPSRNASHTKSALPSGRILL